MIFTRQGLLFQIVAVLSWLNLGSYTFRTAKEKLVKIEHVVMLFFNFVMLVLL